MTESVSIRRRLQPGDLGRIIQLHGSSYSRERGYGIAFEAYVAEGIAEFWHRYDRERDRVWLCESDGSLVGSLVLMHRGSAAQLRYFLLLSAYRGMGLGKRLMAEYMSALQECSYQSSYLWTTDELAAAAALYTRHGFVLTEQSSSRRFGKELVEQRYDWTAPEEGK